MGILILSMTPPNPWKTAFAVGIIYVPIMVRLRARRDAGDRVGGIRARRARARRTRLVHPRRGDPANAWPPIIVESALRVTFAIMLARR
jgi:peptide/nickel transport system permease protein